MLTTEAVPSLRLFLSRRFAVRSPLVSWMIFERAGGAVAWALALARVSPSAATIVGGGLGVTGASLLATASGPAGSLGAGSVLLLSYVFDCTDGQLARATHRTSAFGAWLDVAVDALVVAAVAASLAVSLTDGRHPVWGLLLAAAYGGSRSISLLTSTLVRGADGGLELSGGKEVLRSLYVAVMDTPVAYILLAAFRWTGWPFAAVVAVLSLMTVVQTLVSIRNHIREAP